MTFVVDSCPCFVVFMTRRAGRMSNMTSVLEKFEKILVSCFVRSIMQRMMLYIMSIMILSIDLAKIAIFFLSTKFLTIFFRTFATLKMCDYDEIYYRLDGSQC